jgi:hypothetical protein
MHASLSKAYLAAAAVPGLLILLALVLAMALWAWESRPHSKRPPSTYEDDETPEE